MKFVDQKGSSMKLRVPGSPAAFVIGAALLVLHPALGWGQEKKVIDPFNWLDRYDSAQTITLTGVVSKVDWTNPHIYIYVDVKDSAGKVTSWQVEGYPPNTLKRAGFSGDLLQLGDTVTITAYQAKDGSNTGAASEVTFQDGSKKFAGPASATSGALGNSLKR
jgi:Family of unknown function (DUF6152)